MADDAVMELRVDALVVFVFRNRSVLDAAAAAEAADRIRSAARANGEANLLLASGNSQLGFLTALREKADVPWPQVNIFHMDEYLGLDARHPAGFRNFLSRELLDFIHPRSFHPVWTGGSTLEAAALEYERLLRMSPIDVCALGIGENGHLAFNDPPADFQDPVWVKTVRLAEASRRQQVGEGHFSRLEDVPKEALTLTIPALLAARHILAIAPEARKAAAVRRALRGPIDPSCPASVLRTCPHARLFLDGDSGAGIRER